MKIKWLQYSLWQVWNAAQTFSVLLYYHIWERNRMISHLHTLSETQSIQPHREWSCIAWQAAHKVPSWAHWLYQDEGHQQPAHMYTVSSVGGTSSLQSVHCFRALTICLRCNNLFVMNLRVLRVADSACNDDKLTISFSLQWQPIQHPNTMSHTTVSYRYKIQVHLYIATASQAPLPYDQADCKGLQLTMMTTLPCPLSNLKVGVAG